MNEYSKDTPIYKEDQDGALESRDFSDLIRQVEVEYQIAYDHQRNKTQKNLSRLKLYNNQRKDESRVGETTLFSIIQTVLAALYENQLTATFSGQEDGDTDISENLYNMARYDYKLMKKPILDYFWDWDTCFFGRGLVEFDEFDRSKKYMCPVPRKMNPAAFLRDPDAASVNGLMKGESGMRFGGEMIMLRKMDVTQKNGYFNYLDQNKEFCLSFDDEVDSLIKRATQERDAAQGLQTRLEGYQTKDMGDNMKYPVLKWYTYYEGKRVRVFLSNSRKKVIKFQEIKGEIFPIIDRPLFPHSESWDGVSIPDLVEDKQRHKSAMINLGMDTAKSQIHPGYLYDEDRIKNTGDIKKMGFNKMVGVKAGGSDLRGVVVPMTKASPDMGLVNYILQALDSSAQIATASPEMQQGQLSDEKRTLGELNMVQANVGKRQSLGSKVFFWSEEAFWQQWYWLYKQYFKDDIDEKIVRIRGAYGTVWRPLTKENFSYVNDPDIDIEDVVNAESRNARERILFQSFGQFIMADPTANKRYLERKLAKLNGMEHDEIDRLLPPTIDELIAEEENDKLSNDEYVPINMKEDHVAHWDIHAKAAETPAKEAHLKATRLAMQIRRDQPELFPQQQQSVQNAGETPDSASTEVTETASSPTVM